MIGSIECICQENYYSLGGSGSSPCEACSHGSISSAGANVCRCAIGYYSPDGLSPCFECPEGMTTASVGGTDCQAIDAPERCAAGYFSNTGLAPCTACPDGSGSDMEGSTGCHCEAGYFGDNGLSPCSKCLHNYYSDPRSSKCYECVGFECTPDFDLDDYEAGMTDFLDVLCPIGYYDNTRLEPCERCPTGSSNDVEGESVYV